MTLKQAIAEFARNNPEFSTQAGALNQCDWASLQFIRWLEQTYPQVAKRHRVSEYSFYLTEEDLRRYEYHDCPNHNPNPDPVIYRKGCNERGDTLSPWHCIVQTRTHFVDFTAKQYKETASYPYVMRKQTVATAAAA